MRITHFLLTICSSLVFTPVWGEERGTLHSFRVLSPTTPAVTPGQVEQQETGTGPGVPAVWLAGTIEDIGGGWTERLEPLTYEAAIPVTENWELANSAGEQISTHQSLNTAQLATYETEYAVLDQEWDQAQPLLQPEMTPAPAGSGQTFQETLEVRPWIKWKSTSLTGTWVPGSGDDYGMTDFNLRGTISFPRFPLLSLTPNYQMNFLNGPRRTDVPETLHRMSLNIFGFIPISERFVGMISVAPGLASDLETGNSDAFRITGMGLVVFKQSPQLQWSFGIVYLDREDFSLLPAVGLTWSPDERTKLELSFPRPRLMRQIAKDGERETWMYLAAELGGGSWAVERSNGTDDVLTLRDYRLVVGREYRLPQERSWFWETGLVFGREVEYESGIGDFDVDGSIFLRSGMTF